MEDKKERGGEEHQQQTLAISLPSSTSSSLLSRIFSRNSVENIIVFISLSFNVGISVFSLVRGCSSKKCLVVIFFLTSLYVGLMIPLGCILTLSALRSPSSLPSPHAPTKKDGIVAAAWLICALLTLATSLKVKPAHEFRFYAASFIFMSSIAVILLGMYLISVCVKLKKQRTAPM